MIGEKLKYLRQKYNIKQHEMADIMGVKRASYAGYETAGVIPPVDKLQKVAKHFNVSLDYLVGTTEEMSPEEELKQLLELDPEIRLMFNDYSDWPTEDVKELIAYMKAKRAVRDTKGK